MTKQRTLYLSNIGTTLLFIYYFLLFTIGFSGAIFAILPHPIISFYNSTIKVSPFLLAVIGSIGMALNGSSIFYIRKLYKLCFVEPIGEDKLHGNYKENLGSVVYFLTRPIFSIGFSILIVIGLKTGLMISSEAGANIANGFVYECMFISFFVGFLAGNFIKNLEHYGNNIINKALG